MHARLALVLCLLAPLLLRAGEATPVASEPAPSVPAATPAVAVAPAPAMPAAPAAPAVEPVFATVTIGNALAELVITTRRGAIVSFALRDTHPVTLPKPLKDQAKAQGLPVEDHADPTKVPLAVLGRVHATGRSRDFDNLHNWIESPRPERSADALTGGSKDVMPLKGTDAQPWQVSAQTPTSCTMTLALPDHGLTYALTYTMHASRPTVAASLAVRNAGPATLRFWHRVVPFAGIHQDYPPSESYYLCAFAHSGGKDGSLSKESFPSQAGVNTILVEPAAAAAVDYVGLVSRFCAAWYIPGRYQVISDQPEAAAAPAAADPGERGAPMQGDTSAAGVDKGRWGAVILRPRLATYLQAELSINFADPIVLKPGQRLVHDWDIGVTTFSDAHFARLDQAEKRMAYTDAFYRFFKLLADLLTWCLNMIATVVRNYGLAVIGLTLLIKLALHRTSFRQQASMMKMAKLAPELKALQEQYGTDRQKMALKQMELWKKHDVNPLRGCLPIFIQMPIFMALYQTFNHSAEMRTAGFLWVKDLTLPDVVFAFSTLSWLSWLTINPLPLIYIAVTVWMSFSMKLPPNPDPQQEQMQKMMRWMPVMFGVIFYNMPAGLVLYFTANAILSTLETKYIKRKLGTS